MVASEISMVRSPMSVASPYFSKVESRSLWDEVPETVPDVSKVYKSRECQGKNRDFTPEKWDFNWVSLKISPKANCESSFSLWNALLPLGPHFQTHPTKKTPWIGVIWMAKDWTSGRKTGISIHKLRGISPYFTMRWRISTGFKVGPSWNFTSWRSRRFLGELSTLKRQILLQEWWFARLSVLHIAWITVDSLATRVWDSHWLFWLRFRLISALTFG